VTKLLPEGHVHSDNLAWQPWDESRTMPFVAHGRLGTASVKVLSKDPKSGAESLLYRFDPGWSADRIENTVYENLLIIDGEIEAGGHILGKHAYAYRPEGRETSSIRTTTGASVVTFAGAAGDLASPIAIDCLDTESMPWVPYPVRNPAAKYFVKMLRGDEENLDTYSLLRAVRGFVSDHVTQHDAPEEGYLLDGHYESYDGITGGRYVSTAGTYTHRLPGSPHGFNNIIEDLLSFKHDYFLAETEEILDIVLRAYPRETPAVRALKEGRDPELPTRSYEDSTWPLGAAPGSG
jgi:hypothetical protein